MDMEMILLPEIRSLNAAIRANEKGMSDAEKEVKRAILVDTANKMLALSDITRKEGLLALESSGEGLSDPQNNKVLKHLVLTIVDGTDPVEVARIALLEYFALAHDDYQAIAHIMIIYGVLSIQQGENPYVLFELLKSIVPEINLEREYDRYENTRNDDVDYETLFSGGIKLTAEQKGYMEVYLCDEYFKALDNRNIQRLLRDVEFRDLCIVMNAISGEGRSRIVENLSERIVASMIDTWGLDIDPANHEYSEAACKEAKKAASKVIEIIHTLESMGEIFLSASSEIRFLTMMVKHINADRRAEQKEAVKECDFIIKLLRNYRNEIDE